MQFIKIQKERKSEILKEQRVVSKQKSPFCLYLPAT